MNNYQSSSFQVFCYGTKICFLLTVTVISYWNGTRMDWESRRALQAFQTPLGMSLLKRSARALPVAQLPPRPRDHHLYHVRRMLRSGSSQGTSSITPQAHPPISCPQLDTSFHQKPLLGKNLSGQMFLFPRHLQVSFSAFPNLRQKPCAELPPSPSWPGEEKSISGPQTETTCLGFKMCHPLENRGHLQPLGKEGSKPNSVARWAVRTFWLCVKRSAALQDTRAKRRERQRGTIRERH